MNNVAARFAVWQVLVAALGQLTRLQVGPDADWRLCWDGQAVQEIVNGAVARCTDMPQEVIIDTLQVAYQHGWSVAA